MPDGLCGTVGSRARVTARPDDRLFCSSSSPMSRSFAARVAADPAAGVVEEAGDGPLLRERRNGYRDRGEAVGEISAKVVPTARDWSSSFRTVSTWK